MQSTLERASKKEAQQRQVRSIGIITGGGDCPGLNAVIRAAVKCAVLKYGRKVTGMQDGSNGLIWPGKSRPLGLADVSGILPRGGTVLGTTNRGNPFKYRVMENGVEVERDVSGELMKVFDELAGNIALHFN